MSLFLQLYYRDCKIPDVRAESIPGFIRLKSVGQCLLLNFFTQFAQPFVIHAAMNQTVVTFISIRYPNKLIGRSRDCRVKYAIISR